MPKKSSILSSFRCSFCGKPQDQVVRLIAGPNVFICNECVALCEEIFTEAPIQPEELARSQAFHERRPDLPIYRCSFCDKEDRQVPRLIAGPNSVYICNDCVYLCQEIISGQHNSGE